MSIHQISNNKDEVSSSPFTTPPGASTVMDAVDLDTLNSFDALQCDDGSDLVVELIDLYLQELPRRITDIRDASLATERVLLNRAAHALKGSSCNLGIRHVAEICEKLQRIDSHDSPQTVAALIRLLDYESAMASASLEAVRQRRLT